MTPLGAWGGRLAQRGDYIRALGCGGIGWVGVMVLGVGAGAMPGRAADVIWVTQLEDQGRGSLREAIETVNALGAGEVRFVPEAGVVRLESPLPDVTGQLRLVGPDAGGIAVSGQGVTALLTVRSGSTCRVERLTFQLANPREARWGSAISNAGSLFLDGCHFLRNTNRFGAGGAIFNAGALEVSGTTFATNVVMGVSGEDVGEPGDARRDGKEATGGAIHHAGGWLILNQVVFRANRAMGGAGGTATSGPGPGKGGRGAGGALYAAQGGVTCSFTTFETNRALGGEGGNAFEAGNEVALAGEGGAAVGAAMAAAEVVLEIADTSFVGNVTTGGTGGNMLGFPMFAAGGTGGSASGGAVGILGSRTALIRGGTFLKNDCFGGGTGAGKTPGRGGAAAGGGLAMHAGDGRLLHSSWVSNRVVGGASGATSIGGPPPAAGRGGGLELGGGRVTLEHCTVSGNTARAAGEYWVPAGYIPDPTVPAGDGGGLVWDGEGELTLRQCTVVRNVALGVIHLTPDLLQRVAQQAGWGGGLWNRGAQPVVLEGCVLAGNLSLTNGDVAGAVRSRGPNLLQDPRGASGDLLGMLTQRGAGLDVLKRALNGQLIHGPLEGSAVIDAGPTDSDLAIDQAGNRRRFGAAVDLGAVEWFPSRVDPGLELRVARRGPGSQPLGLELEVLGTTGEALVLEATENLIDWVEIAHPTGQVPEIVVSDRPWRWFRLRQSL